MLRHFDGQPEAAQLRMGRKSSFRVSRHIYLGHDGDIALAGIADYFTYLFLCVESVLFFCLSYRTSYLGKARIPLDFYPPSQPFRQVPVEIVHFKQGSHVDVLFDGGYPLVLASGIQHKTAPLHTGGVGDVGTGKGKFPGRARNPLTQSLHGVDESSFAGGGYGHLFRIDAYLISFGRKRRVVHPADVSGRCVGLPFDGRVAEHFATQKAYVKCGGVRSVHGNVLS